MTPVSRFAPNVLAWLRDTKNVDESALHAAALRDVAKAEVDAFWFVCESCRLAPTRCASLVRAWHALAVVEAALAAESPPTATEFLGRLGAGDLRALPVALRTLDEPFVLCVVSCARAEPFDSPPAPERDEFDRHRRALLRLTDEIDRAVLRRFPSLGVAWGRILALLGALALVGGAVALALRLTVFRPRWRVAFFANTTLTEPAAWETRVSNADQDWGFDAPNSALPPDGFSARFETCLKLPRSGTLVFTVGSDDGSRLFVDDKPVLDSWSDHSFETRTKSLELAAGPHPVRLEYYEHGGNARVNFAASLQGSPAKVDSMLALPGGSTGCGR